MKTIGLVLLGVMSLSVVGCASSRRSEPSVASRLDSPDIRTERERNKEQADRMVRESVSEPGGTVHRDGVGRYVW